jgi:hypothetical protein
MKKSKKNIFKRRVIFEEEYMIDSDGQQKCICIKRVDDHNNNKSNNKKNVHNNSHCNTEMNANKLLASSKSKKYKKRIDSNLKNNNNNRTIESYLVSHNNKQKRLQLKTALVSPQISYENLFTRGNDNNNAKKTQIETIEIEDTKVIPSFLRYKKIAKINNNNIQREKNKIANTKRSASNITENISDNKMSKISERYAISLNKSPIKEEIYEYEKFKFKSNIKSKPILTKITKNKFLQANINTSRNYNNKVKKKIEYNNSEIMNEISNSKNQLYKTSYIIDNNINISSQEIPIRSEKRNHKYHEIKSSSQKKLIEEKNIDLKNSLNNIYNEPKKRYSTISNSINLDDVVKNYDYEFKYKINQRLRGNRKKEAKNISYSNQKDSLIYSQDKKILFN